MITVQATVRRRYRKSSLAAKTLLACGVCAVLVAGLSSPAADAAATKPVLTYGEETNQTTLNPALDPTDYDFNCIAYAALIHYTSAGKPVPALATSWKYVGHGDKTFELTLRKGVHFSDGTELDATAVKNWFTYFAHAKGPFAAGDGLDIKSVTTAGKWQVTLHLGAPDPDLPFELSDNSADNVAFIGGPKAIADPKMLNANTDGAGPYVAVPSASVTNSTYTFVPNKYYYDQKAIRFSKVVVKSITTPSTMLAAIESGQVNVATGDVTTAAAAKSHGLDVFTDAGGWDGMLLMDRSPKASDGTSVNPLGNVKVRQALSYAINRPAIAKALIPGAGAPTDEPPTTNGYVKSLANYYAYNPAKAKALLAAAGYPNGFTLNVMSQTSFGTLGDPMMQAVAQDFAAIGVKLEIKSEPEITQWVNDYEAKTYPASGFLETGLSTMHDFYEYYLAPGGGASSQFTSDDPGLDKLLKSALTAKNPSKYWTAMSREMITQADVITVFSVDAFTYTNGQIGGIAPLKFDDRTIPTEWYPAKR